MRKLIWICLIVLSLSAEGSAAQELSALARVLPGSNRIVDRGGEVELTITMSQGVPYRVFTLDAPRRLVLDFNELDWSGLNSETFEFSRRIGEVRTGLFREGWSRMVVDMNEPLRVDTVVLDTSDPTAAVLRARLLPTSSSEFTQSSGLPAELQKSEPVAVEIPAPKQRQTGESPLVVVLDPGHGGIDPGAESDGVSEAELMLTFALVLEEALVRTGNFKVVLTRTDDSFVPLETRVSIARKAGADVFLSLHADALIEGRATGATIYTLAEEASDAASQKLAERHDRGDLLAGVDLSGQGDVVATVLMDLARTETAPRSEMLAESLVEGLSKVTRMHKRPRLYASFSVLKSPDIPSALIELGFLSSPKDFKQISDAEWREAAAGGIKDALLQWRKADAAAAIGLRQ
jgi:N-acetylmuramoyl-L-alanine amidase